MLLNFFTKENKKQVIDIVENTNKQMFFVKCNTPEAHGIIQSMDLNELAQSNLSTPGFGNADFVMYFLDLKNKKDLYLDNAIYYNYFRNEKEISFLVCSSGEIGRHPGLKIPCL